MKKAPILKNVHMRVVRSMYSLRALALLSLVMIASCISHGGVFAQQPDPPTLLWVWPYHETPLKIRLKWTQVRPVAPRTFITYEYRRSVNDGDWSEWKATGRVLSYFDENDIQRDSAYSYIIRAVSVDLQGMRIGQPSHPSIPKGNNFKKIWFASSSEKCEDPPEYEMLHSFSQPLDIRGRFYLHLGVDVKGAKGTYGECVRAPLGGVITQIIRFPRNNGSVTMSVVLNEREYAITIGHLQDIPRNLKELETVEPGTKLGNITTSAFENDQLNHSHIVLILVPKGGSGVVTNPEHKNPLILFDDPMMKDPQMAPPISNAFLICGLSARPPRSFYLDSKKSGFYSLLFLLPSPLQI